MKHANYAVVDANHAMVDANGMEYPTWNMNRGERGRKEFPTWNMNRGRKEGIVGSRKIKEYISELF